MRRRGPWLVPALLTATCLPAFACLWDYDTLAMERERFPSALELITGKFLRHTREFYEWRIQDRLQRLKAEPDRAEWLDDLAVAYDKTGRQADAIATMERLETIRPGRYETYANLGTFHIHAGQPEKGLPFIAKAIEINPEAHFGREIYQKRLVEYVMSRRVDGRLSLPLCSEQRTHHFAGGFAGAVLAGDKSAEKLEAAVKGVLGMMRFGTHDHPVLLEALGDLLCSGGRNDAKRLAARAYLKASYGAEDRQAAVAYRQIADATLDMQTVHPNTTTQLSLADLERDLRAELEDAEAWYADVREDERKWIREGKDPEKEFAAKYYTSPRVENTESFTLMLAGRIRLLIGLIVVTALAAIAIPLWRRRRAAAASSAPAA